MKKLFLLLVISIIIPVVAKSQELTLAVSYKITDNTRDSREKGEFFSIGINDAVYDLTYSGRTFPDELNQNKSCLVSQSIISELRGSIEKNKISRNVDIDKSYFAGGVHSIYIEISIALVLDGEAFAYILKGDSENIMDSKEYNGAIQFIKDMRKLMKDC
jgi:hypothetical protein